MDDLDQSGVIAVLIFAGILVAIFFAVQILFLINQQNTLKAIQPENRLMRPGEVWLQLIPLFGLVWQFIVVTRISDSLRREFESWQSDTILGMPDAEAIPVLNARPTYDIGIAFCILFCCAWIPFLGTFIGLAGLICWIIYWVKLAEFKRMVEQKTIF